MDLALALLITGVIAGGVSGALLRVWSMASRLYSVESRLAVVEGISTREVKIRAAAERWKRPTKDEEAIAAALATGPAPVTRKLNWWENPSLKKGAHVS